MYCILLKNVFPIINIQHSFDLHVHVPYMYTYVPQWLLQYRHPRHAHYNSTVLCLTGKTIPGQVHVLIHETGGRVEVFFRSTENQLERGLRRQAVGEPLDWRLLHWGAASVSVGGRRGG